jgi:hypothetical protein
MPATKDTRSRNDIERASHVMTGTGAGGPEHTILGDNHA